MMHGTHCFSIEIIYIESVSAQSAKTEKKEKNLERHRGQMWKAGRSEGTWQVYRSISQFCCQPFPLQSGPERDQLISKPINVAEIKAQLQSERTIRFPGKSSKRQSES